MTPINKELLELALSKYSLYITNSPKTPTLYKIVDSTGKHIEEKYYTSENSAELRLMALVTELEKKKSK